MSAELFVTKFGSLGFARVGDLAIFVAEEKMHESDWQEWLKTGAEKLGLDKKAVAISLTASKATPSAAQRKELGAEEARFGFGKVRRNAILSDSAIVRGAITAVQWVIRSPAQMRAFRVDQLADSLKWLHEQEAFDLVEAEATARALLAATNAAYRAAKSA